MRKIDKFYFMIHPTCWAQQGVEGQVSDEFLRAHGTTAGNWYAALNWERQVNRRQMDLIGRMRDNEAMVIYPIGQSQPMRSLIEHASATLGERCIVQSKPSHVEPAALASMSEPIRHFLQDPQMDGRDAFWSVVPEPLRSGMEREIRQACELESYDWRPTALKVIQGNRIFAAEIADEIRNRYLQVDPARVQAEAFGEGFEQCAMTWKAMVAHYLGWSHPIENDYELSVSGFATLYDAEFRGRVALPNAVRLFLWEKSRRRPLAMYAKAQCLLTDPRQYVLLPTRAAQWEIWEGARRVWPADDARLSVENGSIRVPVYASIRKHADDGAYYIMAPNLEFDAFGELMSHAKIVCEQRRG